MESSLLTQMTESAIVTEKGGHNVERLETDQYLQCQISGSAIESDQIQTNPKITEECSSGLEKLQNLDDLDVIDEATKQKALDDLYIKHVALCKCGHSASEHPFVWNEVKKKVVRRCSHLDCRCEDFVKE